MREDICTIPVSEGFEPLDGCPLCRMRAIAQKRVIDFIMGAAMMEPDIRIRTNEMGFCREHYNEMCKANNRLSLALMLDSHIIELQKEIFGEGKLIKPSAKKTAYRAVKMEQSCFVCDKMNFGMERMLDTVYRTYESDKAFRELFRQQTEFCLPHYSMLIENIPDKMNKDRAKELCSDAKAVTLGYLKELGTDVRHFCDMFDYRNSGEDADWGNSKDAIERAVSFLCSGLPDNVKIK